MPMLAAIAVPSSALRAKDVVISWSPLKFPNAGHSLSRNGAAGPGGRCRRTDKPGRRPRLGLAGAGGSVIWTVRRCFLHMPVLLGCKAFSRRSAGHGQTVSRRHQNCPPMSVLKKMLSTDMLPQGLSERQRFMFFAELFEHFSNTGELDPAEDVPFRAAMNSIQIGRASCRERV